MRRFGPQREGAGGQGKRGIIVAREIGQSGSFASAADAVRLAGRTNSQESKPDIDSCTRRLICPAEPGFQPGLRHSLSPARRGDLRHRATLASQPSIALCWAQQKGRRVATSKHGPRTSERPSNHPTEKINYEHLDRSPPRISSSDSPAVREAPGHLCSLRGIQECGAGWREPRRSYSVQRAAWSRGRPALPCRSIQSPHGRPGRSGSE